MSRASRSNGIFAPRSTPEADRRPAERGPCAPRWKRRPPSTSLPRSARRPVQHAGGVHRFLQDETKKWGDLVRAANIKSSE